MVRYILIAFALLSAAMVALTLIIAAITFLVLACAIGIPLYLMSRSWLHRRGLVQGPRNAVDRLQDLYVEGKIDLLEFERRIARHVAAE